MRIAVLPFNAAEGSSEPVARQLANVVSDFLRHAEVGDEVGTINYMRTDEQDGQTRYILASPSQTLNEQELLEDVRRQSAADVVIDGLLSGTAEAGTLHLRWFEGTTDAPVMDKSWNWTEGALVLQVEAAIKGIVEKGGGTLAEPEGDLGMFGTRNSEAFWNWLESVDAMQYIDRAQGMVAQDWSPLPALESALKATELDPALDRAPVVLMELARRTAQLSLAEREPVLAILQKLQALRPEDPLTLFNLGSFYLNVGDPNRASDLLEKASRLKPDESAIWTGLGAAQLALGMPVNGERSLLKAIEVQSPEAFDVSPYDMLSQVLEGQGRGHEIPAIWKKLMSGQPQNAVAYARLAGVYMASGQREEAVKLLDEGLETLDNSLPIKRVYAPILVEQQDFDRAMDFYEDILEEAEEDITLKLEYANVLVQAKLEHDAEKVLTEVLQAEIDPNTRAQTRAWLIEIQQPKRVEILQTASQKASEGDFAGALKELKPLRTWLADYWKLWALLATLHNRLEEYGPAEEAAKKALEVFPGCEQGIVELANSFHGQDRHEEAYGLMTQALQAFPQSLPMALQYGLAAKRVGRTDEARGLAKQVRDAVGDMPDLEPILKEIEG